MAVGIFSIMYDDLHEIVELVRDKTERPEEALCLLAAAQVYIYENCSRTMTREQFADAVRNMLTSIEKSPQWGDEEGDDTWH